METIGQRIRRLREERELKQTKHHGGVRSPAKIYHFPDKSSLIRVNPYAV